MNSLFDDVPQMPNGVMDQLPRKEPELSIMSNLWDGLTDAFTQLTQPVKQTPYYWLYDKASNITGKQVGDTVREMGEGVFHDFPQGTIDLGVDIINATGGLVGLEDDVIDRDKAQVVPSLYSNEEREQLNMKMVEDHSVARLMGQLLFGYAGLRSIAKKGLMGEAVAVAGAGATVDPTEPNLSSFLKDTKFNNALFEFMASGVDEEAGAGERLVSRAKFMAEELGLAFLPIGLIQGVREMKNNPAIREQLLDTLNPERIGSLLDKTPGVAFPKSFIPETKFNIVPDQKGILHLVDEGVQVSTEALPSTGILQGRLIARMNLDKQTQYQVEVNELLADTVEEITGLNKISDINAPSYFEGHIGTSRQAVYEVETEIVDGFIVPTAKSQEQIKRHSALSGYLQDQDAVASHYFVPTNDFSKITLGKIDIGRPLTDAEMIAINRIMTDLDMGLAPVSTARGVNLLNVEGLDTDAFITLSGKIKDELGAETVLFGKNGLADDVSYIAGEGGGYKAGQQKFEEISLLGKIDDAGGSNRSQQWWGNADLVEETLQKVRVHREEFLKKYPQETKTIRQIGEEADLLAQANKTVIRIGDYSKKANQTIYERMIGEAQAILKGGDKEARGWYTIKFQQALDALSKRHPELAQGADQSARDLFSSLVSITSDGSKIKENLRFADDVYQSYKQTGKVNLHIPAHTSSTSFRINLNLLQDLIDEKGLRGALDWLSETQTTKAIKDQYNVATGYKVDVEVPNSTIFGAKLGMFHANIMGQPNWLTMDRWWSRTFNRYRGQMTTQATDSAIEAFRKAGNFPETMRNATLIKKAIEQSRIYAKSGFKDKSAINVKANTVAKKMQGLRDAPQNASDRAFQIEVTERVVRELQKEFPDMTTADLQAILWYGEKYRMREFGSKAALDVVDYSDVTGGLLKQDAPTPPTHLLQ
jgi:hypothetical protein